MFHNVFPVNSFCDNKNKLEKKYWVIATEENFIQSSYKIGLTKCLNKVDALFN